jgi:hypothetical protein
MTFHFRRSALTLAVLLPLSTGCVSAQRSRYDDRYDDRRSDERVSDSRRSDSDFKWSGEVGRDRWVYVRNLNGAVRVEQGTGSKVEVSAIKRWRRGNPEDVKINVRQVGSGRGDVIVCALFRDRDTCDEDGYHSSRNNNWSWNNNNDVSVEFTIRLPAGVRMDASTVNGSVTIDGATSEVVARTVNGSVDARSVSGPVSAKTTNGNIDVRAGVLDSRTEYSTTNGSITVELPSRTNADLDMRTVNGRVSSDFPVTVEGSFSPRRLRAKLGDGGPTVRMSTVNGSIRLRKA